MSFGAFGGSVRLTNCQLTFITNPELSAFPNVVHSNYLKSIRTINQIVLKVVYNNPL